MAIRLEIFQRRRVEMTVAVTMPELIAAFTELSIQQRSIEHRINREEKFEQARKVVDRAAQQVDLRFILANLTRRFVMEEVLSEEERSLLNFGFLALKYLPGYESTFASIDDNFLTCAKVYYCDEVRALQEKHQLNEEIMIDLWSNIERELRWRLKWEDHSTHTKQELLNKVEQSIVEFLESAPK